MDCGRLHTPLLVKSFAVIVFRETIGEAYFGACENEPVKISEWHHYVIHFNLENTRGWLHLAGHISCQEMRTSGIGSPKYIHCTKITSTAMVISPMLWQSWTIKLWPHVVDWFWYEIKKPCQYQIWDQKILKRHIIVICSIIIGFAMYTTHNLTISVSEGSFSHTLYYAACPTTPTCTVPSTQTLQLLYQCSGYLFSVHRLPLIDSEGLMFTSRLINCTVQWCLP